VLVVRINSGRIGLQVDAVRGFLAVPDGLIDRVPQALRRGAGEARIRAICRLDGGERLIGVLAADQLLNADQTARFPASAEPECETIADDGAATEHLLIFRIGADELGIPVSAVETIAALPDTLSRLPGAPAYVDGVMNLRGTVVPVINAGQRFGAQCSTGARRRMIVVRIGEWQAGFGVDAICDVLRVDETALRPAVDPGKEETRIFECLANLTDARRIIPVISPRELLVRAEQQSLRALSRKDSKAEP
jgi:purine-binding chemotaxis protein CheW